MRHLVMAATFAMGLAACAQVLDIDGIPFESSESAGGTTADGGSGTGAGSSQGGATAAAGAGGGTGGSGGVAGGENCTNGVDDDNNELVDCEDPACATFMCTPAPPDGWSGPFVSHVAAMAAACPASSPDEALLGFTGTFTAPEASCASCTCGAPSGVTCEPAAVLHYGSNQCDGLDGVFEPSQVGVCENSGDFGAVDSVRGNSAVASNGGECTPSGGSPTVEPASFAEELRLCGAESGAGCGADSVCMPAAEAPFLESACVSAEGDLPCPAEYTSRRVVHLAVTDNRSCSNCGCQPPQGVSCTASSTVYTNSNCTGNSFLVPHDDTCVTTNEELASVIFNAQAAGGSCSTTGGVPTGFANPTEPTTICCVP